MNTIEKQIAELWKKMRNEGVPVEECGNAIIAWAQGQGLPGDRARVSGPTAKQIDKVLSALIREETNPEYAKLVAQNEGLPSYLS
jgi:hypothetical protein